MIVTKAKAPALSGSRNGRVLCTSASPSPVLALVIPTLREAGNIQVLLGRIRASLDACGVAYEVIVVDDHSGDGIEAIVAEIARNDPHVRCIVRTGEHGLAGAVLRGWSETDANLLGVMDADLQHPPELLPKLLGEVEAGADLAIGSRYLRGGSLRDWSAMRRLLSRLAVWLTLPVQRADVRVSDPMSGFFLVRRSCIEHVGLQSSGFKILLEILARAQVHCVREVPFDFGRRYAGSSKAGVRVALDYLALLLRLYRTQRRSASSEEVEILGRSLPGGQEATGG